MSWRCINLFYSLNQTPKKSDELWIISFIKPGDWLVFSNMVTTRKLKIATSDSSKSKRNILVYIVDQKWCNIWQKNILLLFTGYFQGDSVDMHGSSPHFKKRPTNQI